MSWMSAGFNIYGAYDLAASTLNRKIFDPAKAPAGDPDTPFGRLPAYLSYRPIKISDFFFAGGDGRDSFQSNFASRASVDVSVGAFSGHVEAAYGRRVAESSQYAFANMSYREMLGNLTLEGLSDTRYLTDEFAQALKALPEKATAENLDRFSDFFQAFGAYFVSQITVGATLEYYVAVQQSSNMQATEISAKATAEYNALFVSGKVSAEMSSDQRWESYRKNKTASVKIKGGGDTERALLSQVDSASLDSMTPATAQNYEKWLRSVSSNPAVMDFKLTGIWEVCGAKRKAVEDAFRQYGRLMRPLLRVETRTVVGPSDTYTPGVFLGGSLVPADVPAIPYRGWGGYRLIVIDRRQPTIEGVRMSRLYNLAAGDGSSYRAVFEQMARDLKSGSFIDNAYFIVLASYGMLDSYPPTPEFVRILQEAGAGTQLANWLGKAVGIGTGSIKADVNYILVGIMKSGPSAGVEVFGYFDIPPRSRGPSRISSADVYFYSLGAGHPYVLGAAERKATNS
jgi:hypothetical protein